MIDILIWLFGILLGLPIALFLIYLIAKLITLGVLTTHRQFSQRQHEKEQQQ